MAKCAETAGFLISAPCKNVAEQKCQVCKKPICSRHLRRSSVGDKILCITCFRKAPEAYGNAKNDPYLYSGIFYDDYYQRSYYREEWEGADVFLTDNTEWDTEWEGDFDGS